MAGFDRKTFHILVAAGTLSTGLMLSTVAQARYSAIDVSGNNEQVIYYFGGYCDRTSPTPGDECGSTYKLPYTVNFAGQKTDQLLLGSDGKLQFVDATLNVLQEVDTGIANGPTIYVDFTGQVVDPADDPFADPINLVQLASVGAPNYLAMQKYSLDDDPPPFLTPLANYKITSEIINISWFTCYNPVSRCFSDVHTVTLTPDAEGFNVVFGGINADKPSQHISATFERSSATPEPAAWAMLVLGFGSAGAVLRARRKGPRLA